MLMTGMTYKVEAINIGFLDPRFQAIGNLRWSTNKDWSVPANANMFSDGVFGPFRGPWRESSVSFNGGSDKHQHALARSPK